MRCAAVTHEALGRELASDLLQKEGNMDFAFNTQERLHKFCQIRDIYETEQIGISTRPGSDRVDKLARKDIVRTNEQKNQSRSGRQNYATRWCAGHADQ